MSSILNSMLSRVTGRQQVAESSGHQNLSGDMQAYLVQQFRMEPADTLKLRYVARLESMNPSSSKYVRVFDADQARARDISIRKFDDLDRFPELVLFYGRLNKGKVHYMKRHYVPGTGSSKA